LRISKFRKHSILSHCCIALSEESLHPVGAMIVVRQQPFPSSPGFVTYAYFWHAVPPLCETVGVPTCSAISSVGVFLLMNAQLAGNRWQLTSRKRGFVLDNTEQKVPVGL
jgi:hypothetical protein